MFFKYQGFRRIFLAFVTIFSITLLSQETLYSQSNLQNNPQIPADRGRTFTDIQKYYKNLWGEKNPGKGKGWKQYKRAEYFLEQRLFPNGELQSAVKSFNEIQNYNLKGKTDEVNANKSNWEPMGPTIMPRKHQSFPISGLGRMNCIEIDPVSPNVLWAGASFGGIWKSTDGGSNWVTFPFTEFLSIGISDIKISSQNPNVVYAATGDADGSGGFTQFDTYSVGIIKTTDGGTNWAFAGLQNTTEQKFVIYSILVDPDNDAIVYAGTNKGLSVTTDGGATWKSIYGSQPVRQIIFKPGDATTIYCSMYTPVNDYPMNAVIGKFNTSDNTMKITKTINTYVTRIALGVSKNNTKGVYALCVQYENGGGQGFHSLLKSIDSGENWSVVTSREKGSFNYLGTYVGYNSVGGQGLYDLGLAVSPTNMNELYIGGVNIWKSTNGGQAFTPVAEWTGYSSNVPWVHADIHELQFDQSGNIYSANDGGINKTTNKGTSWTDLSDGLQITSFYKLSCSKTDDKIMLLGAQDNGTHRLKDGVWDNVYGGDGMANLIDYTDPKYMYCSTYNGNFNRSTDGGNSFVNMLDPYDKFKEYGAWVTPIEIDPVNPSIIYIGLYNLVKSTDRGANFAKVSSLSDQYNFTSLKVAPSNTNYIYGVKKYSSSSKLLVSKNGGKSWIDVYSSTNYITDIEVDPSEPNRVWITVSGYNAENKVLEILGTQVTNISSGLPNIPVNTIVLQKNSPNRLYVGTDNGVFYSESPGRQWIRFSDNLPNVVVSDLVIQENTGYLRAATYGRGLWQTKIIDCNLRGPSILYNGTVPTGNITICEGDTIVLVSDYDYNGYEWSTGEKTKSLTITKAGNYILTVSDANGCTASTATVTVDVTIEKSIKISTNEITSFCENDSLELTATFGFSKYEWSNGLTGRKIFIKDAGAYTVKGTYGQDCFTFSEPVTFTVKPVPPKPAITEEGNSLVSTEAASYQWYLNNSPITGAVAKSHTPTVNGDYRVSVGNSDGCKSMSDAFTYSGSNDVDEIPNVLKYVSVKPNPTYGSFVLETYSYINDILEITITDLIGTTVISYSSPISGPFSKSFDLSGKSSGVYIVNIKIGENTWRKKIIRID